MPKSRRIILIAMNASMLAIALTLFAIVAITPALHSIDSSHSQVVAKIEGVSDIPRLRSLISRDDEYIRILEHVILQFAVSSKAAFIFFSVLAASNLALLVLPHHPKQ